MNDDAYEYMVRWESHVPWAGWRSQYHLCSEDDVERVLGSVLEAGDRVRDLKVYRRPRSGWEQVAVEGFPLRRETTPGDPP